MTTGRLSLPASAIEAGAHYDAVVVGSGYGGGVAACRIARAGRRVAVLERGREFLPGEFPKSVTSATSELQVRGRKVAVGSETALFDVRMGEDIHVLMGCGLGGTSLINANVCLTPDARLFAEPVWPKAVRSDGLLAEGYVRARHMLRPATDPGWRSLDKVRALGRAASVFGREAEPVPLHVAFSGGPNAAGVEQPACTQCGDCCSGCNIGAKTTVASTYLADAAAHGASIFVEARVVAIRKQLGGIWSIELERPAGWKQGWSKVDISADTVVLAAGTLGSTEILLRSREQGLALSERLGERLTSNGDAIAIAYNTLMPANAVGVGIPPKVDKGPVGAAVDALIDLRSGAVREGLVIVECALPSAFSPLLPALLVPGGAVFGWDANRGFKDELDELGRATLSLLRGAYSGAVHNTLTFLLVGHDKGDGRMRLDDNRLIIDWPKVGEQEVFARGEEAMKTATAALGGTYLRNPLSERMLGSKPLTVHPLGGCVMAEDRSGGVVNDRCQVYDGRAGADATAVHSGLFVCDGAVMPTSLGVHPLLTITAVAERAMLLLAQERGWDVREGPTPRRDMSRPAAAQPLWRGEA